MYVLATIHSPDAEWGAAFVATMPAKVVKRPAKKAATAKRPAKKAVER